jgi:hypothetical protein
MANCKTTSPKSLCSTTTAKDTSACKTTKPAPKTEAPKSNCGCCGGKK